MIMRISDYIRITLAMVVFLAGTSLWLSTPGPSLMAELTTASSNAWWSESIVAGTFGMIGTGFIAMIIYPVPLITIMLFIQSKKWMDKIMTWIVGSPQS